MKERLKNSLNVAKRKSKTANSNLQKFIIFIRCFHGLYLSFGGFETENQGKISNKITNIDYWFEFFSGYGQPFGHGSRRIIYWIYDCNEALGLFFFELFWEVEVKTSNHVSRKYPRTTVYKINVCLGLFHYYRYLIIIFLMFSSYSVYLYNYIS